MQGDAPKAERALMENFAVRASEEAAVAFLKHVRTPSNRNLGAVQGLVRRLSAAEAMGPVRSRTHAQVAGELMKVWLKDLQGGQGAINAARSHGLESRSTHAASRLTS